MGLNPALMKNNILLFLLLFSFLGQAKVTWFWSEEESAHKLALVPSYKRSNFLGHILASRLFIYPTSDKGLYLSLSGHWGLKPIKGVKSHLIYWGDQSEWSSFLQWEQTFDPVYKQESTKRIEIPVQKKEFHIQYLKTLKGKLKAGLFVQFQERREKGDRTCTVVSKEKKTLKNSCYGFSPHELGGAAGVKMRWDTRDNIFNPSQGYLFQTDFKVGYEHYNLADIFLQMESQISFIFSVLEKEKWVLNFAVGGSLFDPNESDLPYSFQFKLGGIDKLRGYLQGRFHSGQYYLAQGEFRWPLLSWLESVLFIDLGQVNWFKPPLFSAGAGVRIGLPPSYDKKIRIEMGWGKDQNNFVVAFAYPY